MMLSESAEVMSSRLERALFDFIGLFFPSFLLELGLLLSFLSGAGLRLALLLEFLLGFGSLLSNSEPSVFFLAGVPVLGIYASICGDESFF